jgi:hypothetical protein
VRGGGWRGADAAPTGQALRVDGAAVSALQRDDAGALVVRLSNLSSEPAVATLSTPTGPFNADIVDLTGAVLGACSGSVSLRPWELVTLRAVGA